MKKLLGILVLGLVLIFNGNVFAETFLLKCPEKITKIREDSMNMIEEGKILGIIYVKLDESKSKVTVHYNYELSEDKPFEIFKNEKAKKNVVGFSFAINDSTSEFKIKDSFMFLKVENTYALTRSSYWWSAKTKEYEEMLSDYDSTSKCTVLNKNEYNKLLK
jgi:hypothetical protein